MNNGAHVLVVSRDQALLQTRTLILGTFFQAESAGRVAEAEAAMAQQDFELVVLCYTLSDGECQRVIEVSERRNPRPRILTLSNSRDQKMTLGDDDCSIDKGPYELFKKIGELLGQPLKLSGKGSRSPVSS